MSRSAGVGGALSYYRVSGWGVSSNRRLPYLATTDVAAEDIAIRFGSFRRTAGEPAAAVGGFRIFSPGLAEFSTEDGFWARIAEGRLIEVDPAPGVSDAETQTLVFGRCFGMLCLQRGRPALHACAVWLGGGAIAVAGASGAGKSTTARALMRRGHDLMTDDQLVLDPETCLAQACIPSNKLCLDAAEGLGEALDPTQRILRGAAKFHAPAPRFRPDPGPLRAVFLLAPRPDLARPEVRRLSPTQAIANLDPMIVRRDVAAAIGALPGVFAWLSRVAAAVPVYAIWRPDELAGLDRLVDQLVEIGAAHGATGGTRRRARGRQGGAPAT